MTAAGGGNVAETLKQGTTIGGRSYKVHLTATTWARRCGGRHGRAREFIYWTDDGSAAALRYGDMKVTFLSSRRTGCASGRTRCVRCARRFDQPAHGPSSARRTRARDGLPALVHGAHVGHRAGGRLRRQWLQSFRDFPPRQKPGSFNLERVMEAVTSSAKN